MHIDWTALLVSWLPFTVLILVWIFLSQRAGGTRWGRMNGFYEAQVTEMQRTNALLDRIAVALEKRAETSAQP
jgi:cell division protein FtsW (lipid II flippase)